VRRPSFFVAVLADQHPEQANLLLAEIQQAASGFQVYVLLFCTPHAGAAGQLKPAFKILTRNGWHTNLGGEGEALTHAKEHGAEHFVFLHDHHTLVDDFFAKAAAVSTQGRVALSRDGAFICQRPGLDSPETTDPVGLVSSRHCPPEPEEPPGEPESPLEAEPAQPPPPIPELLPVATEGRVATFLVPTHHRPQILRACLQRLASQQVPSGWEMEILVGGTAGDPGKGVAAEFGGVQYVEIPSPSVTVKLNTMVNRLRGELVLLADDDDLQPPNRLAAAAQAHEEGYDWSGSGDLWFYHVKENRLTLWKGRGEEGLVGTSLSFRATMLRKVGGWPLLEKGKDGPLARKLRKAGARFKDLTPEIGPNLVCLQHGQNLWGRPIAQAGQKTSKGRFTIEGHGDLQSNLWRFEPSMQRSLSLLGGVPVQASVSPSEHAITCSLAGPGQSALIDGLLSLKFKAVGLPGAQAALRQGKPVLFHGWQPQYRALGQQYPGLVHVLWHSGFTGSDLMGEGTSLAVALREAKQGTIKLLWLERRDVLPQGALYFAPVWDPDRLPRLIGNRPERKNNAVMTAFHGKYPGNAKNVLASLAGCARTGAELHLSESALEGVRGPAAREILADARYQVYPFLTRAKTLQLVASMTVMTHVSVSDTWPYLVMEAVYAGTPVVLCETINWIRHLSPWAQERCVVRPATSSADIYRKVKHLLDNPADRERLVGEQREVLDKLAVLNKAEAVRALHSLGFLVRLPAETALTSTPAPVSEKTPSLSPARHIEIQEIRRKPASPEVLQKEIRKRETTAALRERRPHVLITSPYRFMARTMRIIEPLIPGFRFEVCTSIPQKRPDLVWSLYPFKDGQLARQIKARFQVPFLLTLRGQFWHMGPSTQTGALQVVLNADRIVVLAGMLGRKLVEQFPQAQSKCIHRIPNGGFPEYQIRGNKPETHPRLTSFKRPFLLCVTNFQFPGKREAVDKLVGALDRAGFPGTFVVAACDGPGNPKKTVMGRCGRFIGFVADKERLYRAADLFLYDSTIDGQPTVLMEALSAGLPCVVGRAPTTGTEEFILHGQTGFVFDKPDQGVRLALRALKNPTPSRRLGLAGRKFIEQECSWEQAALRYQKVITEMIEQSR